MSTAPTELPFVRVEREPPAHWWRPRRRIRPGTPEGDIWDRAVALWVEYRRTHDAASFTGPTVGVDPDSGEMFFGANFRDISLRLLAGGNHRPLCFMPTNYQTDEPPRAGQI